jgi:phospholipid/cholesterol/gamma-HCH transport system substrate-binding protein
MGRTIRLGVFVVASLLLFGTGIFWIGNMRFLFSRTWRLNADFDNVAGLSNGAEVRVAGIHRGSVRNVTLPRRPTGKVHVEMDLDGDTRNVIKKDSKAAIKSEGLVGDRYVEISFGSDGAEAVDKGGTISSEPPLQISDLMRKADGILDYTQGAMQAIDDTSRDLRAISAKINSGQGTVGALINDRDIYQHAAQAASTLQEDMEALKHNFFLRGFFKNRGYEDATDLSKHEISRLPRKPPAKEFSWEADKIFDKPDTAKLKKTKALNEAGKYMESTRFGLAVVEASTDLKGDSEKDRTLTEARAMVVRDHLVQNFKLDDTRVKTYGIGKSQEAGDKGRISVLIYPPGTSAQDARKDQEQKKSPANQN